MKTMKFTEDTILQYLDGELTPGEKQMFEDELRTNKIFAALFKQHKLIHQALATQPVHSPTPGFAQRVMAGVEATAREAAFFNRSRKFVLLLIFLAIASVIFYSWVQFYPALGSLVAKQVTIRDFTLNLYPARQLLSSAMLFKIVLFANGLISLLLFDRAILRPYFARRRQRYSMQNDG